MRPVDGAAVPLSSTFHCRVLALLSGRAIIGSVNRLAPALAGLVGLSLLVSACGGSSKGHVAQPGSAQETALAFSRCMRSHGVPNFPDPDSQGNYPPQSSASAQAKHASLSAQDACKHLLARGGSAGTPQDRRDKFAFALQVAGCLRAHGYPNFPDPTVSSQGTSQDLNGAGIDTSSPQFQAVETACETHARKALGLP